MKFSKKSFAVLLCFLLLPGFSAPARAQQAIPKVVLNEESILPESSQDGFALYVMPLLGADCMLLSVNGRWMLVDMGKKNDFPAIKAVLDRLGVKKVDIAFNTHPHSDHIGSMALLAQEVEVGRFITFYPEDFSGDSILQRSTMKHLKAAGIPVETMTDGSRFSLGEAQFLVMKTTHKNVNGSSAMLHVQYGETSFLLAADVNRSAQNRLAVNHGEQLKADVLKYPHHGQEKLDQGFMEAVSPEFALITHGSLNTMEGQKWLDRHEVPFLFASWGVITAFSDGQTITLYQEMTEESLGFKERWEKDRQQK